MADVVAQTAEKCKGFADHLISHKSILTGILLSKSSHHIIIRSHDKKRCKPSETKRNLSMISTFFILIAWVLALVGRMQIIMAAWLALGVLFWFISDFF